MKNFYSDTKFGTYKVWLGDNLRLQTPFKVEAIESVNNSGGHITWHFNDEVFSCFDWQKEISESISELYRQRAQSLREKYSKIVIMYSGGYDSHNMLMSFLDNNIPVDGVCNFYNSFSHEHDDVINEEWNIQTCPRMQQLKTKHPELDFFRIDTSINSLNMIDWHADDWRYLGRGSLNPSSLGLSYLHTLLPAKYQADGTVILFGLDKPRVRYKDGRFIFNFMDFIRPPFLQDSKIEYFYWSPDCPQLIIKQAQLVKNYWAGSTDLIESLPTNRKNTDLGIVLDHNWIPSQQQYYPSCLTGKFLTWPSKNPTLQNRDWWIIRGNTDYSDKIKDLVTSSVSSIGLSWFNQCNSSKGLISFLSRDYFL